MDTIKLKNPLKVNGKDVAELKLDFDLLTVDGFIRAEGEANKAKGDAAGSSLLVEGDYTYHLYLAFEAICATTPEIDMNDLGRLSGPDVMSVMRAGRFFIMQSAAGEDGESTPETSEAPSGGTPTSSTPARTK